jgi:hypothetical protein
MSESTTRGDEGTASVSQTLGSVPIRADGPAFNRVIAKFGANNGEASSNQLRSTATETVRMCLETYSNAFGPGEVGASGKGLTNAVPRGGGPIHDGSTGLIYGRIQSGKTITAIATAALAADNGFRCVIVLTSDNTWLGKQTFGRFRDELDEGGPAVRAWTDWSDDPGKFGREDVQDYLELHGVVLVSTKNIAHLGELLEVLREADARQYPALIIDDEADNASLNTSAARQARHGRGAFADSPIYDKIGAIRKAVPHHIYLQVTATPQSLLLQKLDERCRPAFCILSKTGPDYMGGELFFSEDSDYWIPVEDSELDTLRGGDVLGTHGLRMPEGLRRALCFFFVGSCYKLLRRDPRRDTGYYSMLVHVDYKQVVHANLRDLIRQFVRVLDRSLNKSPESKDHREAVEWLRDAYEALGTTATGMPPLDDIVASLKNRIQNALPQIIDANNPNDEPDYRPGMNILIGGHRLGRGITVKGLFITYYGRDAKVKMTDTVLQHARMFGYRQYLRDVTRLFVPERIWNDFQRIHESDEGMRNAIGDDPNGTRVLPVWVGSHLKPTRANVLDPSALGAFLPGRAIFPPDPKWRSEDVKDHSGALDKALKPYKGDDTKFYRVPIKTLVELLKHMPSNPMQDYSWEDERVRKALEAMGQPPWNLTEGFLNVRTRGGKGLELKRQDPPFHGFASGDWLAAAKKQPDVPTLIVMFEKGEKGTQRWDDQPLYLPTLVLPDSRFVIMFSYR